MTKPKRNWQITNTIESINIMTWTGDTGIGHISACGASNMGFCWYLNRVNVPSYHRGQGLGIALVTKLQDALIEQQSSLPGPHPSKLIVTPGGYGSDVSKLKQFYEACGFVAAVDKPNELLMEWVISNE